MIGTDTTRPVARLQLMTGRGADGGAKPEERRSPARGLAIRRVAVVEDELMVAWTIESLLEDLGLDVVGMFANGEDAVAALEDAAVDLICLDINLGRGMDGIETARPHPGAQPAAILFISAYSDDDTRTRIGEVAPDAALDRQAHLARDAQAGDRRFRALASLKPKEV
jgi:CheY-like chemotaxis protein